MIGYGLIAIILGPVFHRFADGEAFARLAVAVAERYGFTAQKAGAHFLMQMAVLWTRPIEDALTKLLHEGEEIGHAPVLGDLAVAHPHDVDRLELNLAASRRHAQEFSQVRAVIGFIGRYPVAIGELPMDLGAKVGEGAPQGFVELSHPVLIRRATRLRRVVEK